MLTFVDLIEENREFQEISFRKFYLFIVLLETKLVDLVESEMDARRDLLQEKSQRQKVEIRRLHVFNNF